MSDVPNGDPTIDDDADLDDPEVEGHGFGINPNLGIRNLVVEEGIVPKHRGDTDV